MAMIRTRSLLRGFSLIELMVAITVAAILTVIAVPSFTNAIRGNRISSASNALLADLSYARAEAVTRGTDVSMCPSADGKTCTGSTAYDTGWLVYTYTNGKAVASTAYDSSSVNNTILRYTTARTGVSIQSQDAKIIGFGSQGQTLPIASTPTRFAFVTCFRTGTTGTGQSTTANLGVQLTVSGSGSVSNINWPVGTACTAPVPAP
jgi:type IV fimbrial biogenesis protein FimT